MEGTIIIPLLYKRNLRLTENKGFVQDSIASKQRVDFIQTALLQSPNP